MFRLLVLDENLEIVKVALTIVAERSTEDIFNARVLALSFSHLDGLYEIMLSTRLVLVVDESEKSIIVAEAQAMMSRSSGPCALSHLAHACVEKSLRLNFCS